MQVLVIAPILFPAGMQESLIQILATSFTMTISRYTSECTLYIATNFIMLFADCSLLSSVHMVAGWTLAAIFDS